MVVANMGTRGPRTEDGRELPRYERPHESPPALAADPIEEIIAFQALDERLAISSLTPGAADLLKGLLRVGRSAMFAGGGAGIEYGSLLKTAARPDHLRRHCEEAAEYLHAHQVDVLVVPGMSGYPVGSMYSVVSGIPAVLLKKQKLTADAASDLFPEGSFLIPSYTGDGDVVMSADPPAVQDIVDGILEARIAAQQEAETLDLTIRMAGADDIIDKATMSKAVSDSALVVGARAVERFMERYRATTGDMREATIEIRVVAWVTPLIKGYNRPHEHLQNWFGIAPMAGLNVTSVHLDPPALGIEGLGVVAFRG